MDGIGVNGTDVLAGTDESKKTVMMAVFARHSAVQGGVLVEEGWAGSVQI